MHFDNLVIDLLIEATSMAQQAKAHPETCRFRNEYMERIAELVRALNKVRDFYVSEKEIPC